MKLPSLTALILAGFFAATPSSTNFTLKTYDFGNGGGTGSSTNYSINGMTNGQSGDLTTSTTYDAKPGLNPPQDSNVPPAPTVTNPSNYYDRLRIALNTGNNPSDTTYAIAVSTDNFATVTNYVQNDNTVGPSLGSEDRQTYTAWGGGSGFLLLGLAHSTTYQVKVKAFQGKFTESGYGPMASAATVAPSITFSVTTSLAAVPPFSLAFSSLVPGSIVTPDGDAVLSLTTNALLGGSVYVYDQYAGLRSGAAAFTIAALSGDLGTTTSGYGAQVTAASQGSGGPFSAVAPFNNPGDTVGALSSSIQPILTTPSPLTTGSATVRLKAKSSATTPTSTDYADRITFVAGMNY